MDYQQAFPEARAGRSPRRPMAYRLKKFFNGPVLSMTFMPIERKWPKPCGKRTKKRSSTSIPIIMGGKAGKIYQRIARHGDGWFIPGAGIDELPPMLADLRAACEAEGRNYDEIELTVMWGPKGGAESLKALADLGIARVVTILGGDGIDGIKAIAEAHIR